MAQEAPQSDASKPAPPKPAPPEPTPTGRAVSRGLSGCLPFSSLLLGLQASAPLSGSWHAPGPINWFLLALLSVSALDQFRRGDSVTRVAVGLLLVALLQLLTITEWFQVISTDHLASVLSAGLSETWKGMPLVALLQAWSALCVGFLCHQCLAQVQLWPRRHASSVAIALSSFTALVGVRAVIGYASGNTSLIAW